MWQCRCTPCANACLQGTAHVNVGNAGASFSWDVLDPALLSQSLYTTVAVAHGYSKMNVTRTSLSFQVCSALRHRFLAGSLLELLMGVLHRVSKLAQLCAVKQFRMCLPLKHQQASDVLLYMCLWQRLLSQGLEL